MLQDRIIRAWKDPEFRMNLSQEELAELPSHPAGAIELSQTELEHVFGGRSMASGSQAPSRSSGSSSSNHRRVRWSPADPADPPDPFRFAGSSVRTWRDFHQRESVKPRFSR